MPFTSLNPFFYNELSTIKPFLLSLHAYLFVYLSPGFELIIYQLLYSFTYWRLLIHGGKFGMVFQMLKFALLRKQEGISIERMKIKGESGSPWRSFLLHSIHFLDLPFSNTAIEHKVTILRIHPIHFTEKLLF